MVEYTMPFKQKHTPFHRCSECGKRKYSVCFYHVYDNGLNDMALLYWVCKKCMKEARERAQREKDGCKHWEHKGGIPNYECTHPYSKQQGCWSTKTCYLVKQCDLYEKKENDRNLLRRFSRKREC